MAAQAEGLAGGLVSGACAADQESLGAALVAALELALLTAHRLLARLDSAAGRHAEAAEHLERALALAASGTSLDDRVPALLELARPNAATGDPAAARARPNERHARPVPLDAGSGRDRPERSEAGGATSAGEPPACLAGLTRREAEVLRLIAAGRSNREIAAAFYLSPRTAERHVANIYLKLGAHSKAEAAAYALRHGLA